MQVLGTCGNCGGPVVLEDGWFCTIPQKPHCKNCGSIPKEPFGIVMEMEPKPEIGKALQSIVGTNSERVRKP